MQYQTNEVVYEEYVVKPKDSLYTIAKEFKTTVAELTDLNMLTTNVLYPNQVLLVPTHSKTLYTHIPRVLFCAVLINKTETIPSANAAAEIRQPHASEYTVFP